MWAGKGWAEAAYWAPMVVWWCGFWLKMKERKREAALKGGEPAVGFCVEGDLPKDICALDLKIRPFHLRVIV